MIDLPRRILKSFIRCSVPDAAERWSASHFHASRPAQAKADAPLVVIEAVEDLFFYDLHGTVLACLRGVRNVRVTRWASRSFSAGAAHSLKAFIVARLDQFLLSRLRWGRLYDALCDLRGARADQWRAPWTELSFLWRAWRLYRGLTSKDHLAVLTVDGILIGDLVIDTYLRFLPAIEVDLKDSYLFWILRQALKDIAGTRAFFQREKPSLYLSTYSTYIQHGIPVRVAITMGIPAWAFANAQEFSTRLTVDHLLHTRDSANYASDFLKMTEQGDKLARAGALLGGRLSGVADTVTSIMRSAYQVRTQDVPDVRGAAVVFLHDFYDSPHIYRWMVFHDFWEWACFTVETLQEAGLPFFLKPHPSQRPESSRDLDLLVRKYPGVRFISSDVSNRQLVDAGMACAVTVYGSVAAEMAYLGVPSIACGDNPHVSFDAFHLAHNRAEYRALLRGFQTLPRDADRLRHQACAFYYMHNLSGEAKAEDLRSLMYEFFDFIQEVQERPSSFDQARAAALLAKFEESDLFRDFILTFADDISRSGDP